MGGLSARSKGRPGLLSSPKKSIACAVVRNVEAVTVFGFSSISFINASVAAPILATYWSPAMPAFAEKDRTLRYNCSITAGREFSSALLASWSSLRISTSAGPLFCENPASNSFWKAESSTFVADVVLPEEPGVADWAAAFDELDAFGAPDAGAAPGVSSVVMTSMICRGVTLDLL